MSQPVVQVAVGVILNSQQQVLVSQRAANTHQGGKWEFPGGKVEKGESVTAALSRELFEELGISVKVCEPLMTITHAYPEKTVRLCVFKILKYTGEARGREQQPLLWRDIALLKPDDFPAANRGIMQALTLPQTCVITPEPAELDTSVFLQQLEAVLQRGKHCVLFRSYDLGKKQYLDLAQQVQALCRRFASHCALNMPLEWLDDVEPAVLHLNSSRVMALATSSDSRLSKYQGYLSASCHNEKELKAATALGVDWVFLSPVLATASHPGAEVLGWTDFQILADMAPMPVYALGGLGPGDVATAKGYGAQGVAGISQFWAAG